jgi:hypothetical protein
MKTAFEVGDVVLMKGSEDVALTVIGVGEVGFITVAWFADGPILHTATLPAAVLKASPEN